MENLTERINTEYQLKFGIFCKRRTVVNYEYEQEIP